MSDVEAINIDAIKLSGNRRSKYNLLVEDEKLVDLILTSQVEEGIYYYDYGTSFPETMSSVTIQEPDFEVVKPIENKEPSFYQDSSAKLTLKLKNGKTCEYTKYLDSKTYQTVIESLGSTKINYVEKNIVPLLSGINLSKGYSLIKDTPEKAFRYADEMLYADKLSKKRRNCSAENI